MKEIPARGQNTSVRNISRVVIIGGTHGNERTGIHAVQHIRARSREFRHGSVKTIKTIFGNPAAAGKNVRYIDQDLNRSFQYDYRKPLSSAKADTIINGPGLLEVRRAMEIRKELNALAGPVDFSIDLHTTTSNMGNCLIVSDNEKWTDLLCAMVMAEIPSGSLLYDLSDRKSDLTSSSLGSNHITLEMGPVQQGVADYNMVETAVGIIKSIIKNVDRLNGKDPENMVLPSLTKFVRLFHKIDYPRNRMGIPTAMIHPEFMGKDYHPLKIGQPVFKKYNGDTIGLGDAGYFPRALVNEIKKGQATVPLFVGESAYVEKGIAFITAKVLR